jgi:hypothetical protein
MARRDWRKVIAAVWDGAPVQRFTVRKHRNLLLRLSACTRKLAPTIPT